MNRLSVKNFLIVSAFLLFSNPITANSLELSLESNKAESGTVGYVDIDLVFKKCSLTKLQKDSFKDKIKEKENFINTKRETLFALKAEISQLKQEKEFALRLPLLIENQKKLNDLSSPAAPINKIKETPISSETLKSSIMAGAQGISTATIKAAPEISAIDMPGITNVPLNYFKFSVSTSAAVIETVIIKKSNALKQLRKEIEVYRTQAETELLNYENRQTEIILGKIYLILKELAIKEGVSVIIDKRSILFGNFAVDLTDKLLLKLEEEEESL
ncbi:MAG: hypothetical protein U9Q34_01410 [Elusimicrobiota bacterium]|nr:hypothetical protein [Elusimicrobiota bacterium]